MMCPADHPRSQCLNQTPPSSERISPKTPSPSQDFLNGISNFQNFTLVKFAPKAPEAYAGQRLGLISPDFA